MSISAVLGLHIFDNKVLGNYPEASSALSDYFSKIRKAVEYSFKIAGYEVKKDHFTLKERDCSKLEELDVVDALFDDMGLTIYPDNYVGDIPLNGVKESEYWEIKKIINDIASGNSNIKIDEAGSTEFRKSVLLDILILLSRPKSRELFLELAKQKDSVTIIEGGDDEYFNATKIIKLNLKHLGSRIARTSTNESFYAPKTRFIALAHELIHFFHYCLYGEELSVLFYLQFSKISELEEMIKLMGGNKLYQLLENATEDEQECDNIGELYAIKGDAKGLLPALSINEQNILKDFELPIRENHRGIDLDVDTPMETIWDKVTDAWGLPASHFYRTLLHGALLNILNYFENGGTIDKIPNITSSFELLFSKASSKEKSKQTFSGLRARIYSIFLAQSLLSADLSYRNALLYAAEKYGFVKICQELLKSGAFFDSESFFEAITYQKIERIIFLLENGTSANQIMNRSLLLPLAHAAARGNIEICKLLLNAGALIDAQDKDGDTAINRAIAKGRIDLTKGIIQTFVERGCRLDLPNNKGQLPIDIAMERKCEELVGQLIEKESPINAQNENAPEILLKALFWGNIKLAKILLENGCRTDLVFLQKLNLRRLADGPVLDEILELILKNGPPMDEQSGEDGSTLIHLAILCGANRRFTKFLLKKGCRLDLQNNRGELPIDIAVKIGDQAMFQSLVDAGSKLP